LSQGVIRGWDKLHPYYFNQLAAVAQHFQISLDDPWEHLPDTFRKTVLYGSGRQKIAFTVTDERGNRRTREQPFEGVLPHLERRYKETESPAVREELSQYLVHSACAACEGSRLRKEARFVRVADTTLGTVVRMPILDASRYYNGLTLTGQKGEIADKILKEIRERLHFLVSVGLEYLSLERSAETLSGGEAQRIRLASQIGRGPDGA